MRIRWRLLLGMFGLVFAVPAWAVAAPFGDDASASTVAAGEPAAQARPLPHRHRGLFGRRHCVECQRALVKARDGVDVPAPPPIETAIMPGQVVAGQVKAEQGGSCPTCQGNVVVTGPVLTADAHAPGYAVVDGAGSMASAGAAGYAVANETAVGYDPAPIGVSRSTLASYGDPRMAAMGPRAAAGGSNDPSVVPASIPPAQVAMQGPGHDRPHIISHLLGLPKLGQMKRDREDKEREKHAAIAYGDPSAQVTELPASMVYGKGDH